MFLIRGFLIVTRLASLLFSRWVRFLAALQHPLKVSIAGIRECGVWVVDVIGVMKHGYCYLIAPMPDLPPRTAHVGPTANTRALVVLSPGSWHRPGLRPSPAWATAAYLSMLKLFCNTWKVRYNKIPYQLWRCCFSFLTALYHQSRKIQ